MKTFVGIDSIIEELNRLIAEGKCVQKRENVLRAVKYMR